MKKLVLKMNSLKKSAQKTLQQCMGLKKNESLLIITDKNKKKIAKALLYEGAKICHNCMYVEIPEGKVNGEEPPKGVAGIMKKFDVIIGITTKSLTHTMAVREARSNARIATMPGITESIFKRGMSVNYRKIAERTNRLKRILRKASKIRVTTKLGTDITMGRGVMEFGNNEGFITKRGELNNLPAGEAAFVPVYRSSEGIFMIDASIDGAGRFDKPIKINVKRGYAVKIEGGKAARRLGKMLRSCGKNAFNIAELGIGTNDKARICGNVLEDEKVMGTAHIALGNSKGLGGNIYAKCHLDGVFKKPTIYADNKIIMKDGKLLVR